MPKLRKKPTNIEIYHAKRRAREIISSAVNPSPLSVQTSNFLRDSSSDRTNASNTESSISQDYFETDVVNAGDNMEDCPFLVSTSTEKEEYTILGRRIVNVGYIFDQLCEANKHSEITGCSISNLKLRGESKSGLKSIFHYECNMCGYKCHLHTDLPKPNTSSINDDVVLAGAATGIGFTQIEEFLSGIDVPSLSTPTFRNIQEKLINHVEEVSAESCFLAAQEEKQYALENGNVDDDGVPFITVVLDGMWTRRSYGSQYNSASGCATIIGYHTKKVLFMGSSAILEGFKKSEEMYGLRYKYFIGDGDSNSYRKIIDAKPYGDKENRSNE
uniref:Mutator-like transposase domain-containing protein n=1 Tax=Phlebotomus papatasi TaxID=29031 RepID=A0A1B0DE29_PHLPP